MTDPFSLVWAREVQDTDLGSHRKGGFCAPVARQHLSVWLLQVDWGATKVVTHCCIDRYSNYILLHSVRISIQHQHTPLKLHYTLAKWNKSPTFIGFGTQKKRDWPSLGLGIKLCHGFAGLQKYIMTFNLWFSVSGVASAAGSSSSWQRVHLKAPRPRSHWVGSL